MEQSDGVVDVYCFGDSRQKFLLISGEALVFQVVGGVRPLSPTTKARTRSSLSHGQGGVGIQSMMNQMVCFWDF